MEREVGEEAMKATGEEGEGEKVGVAEVEENMEMEKEELEGLEGEVFQEIHQAEEEEGGEAEEGVALHLLSLASLQVGYTLHRDDTHSCLRRNWWRSKGRRKGLG